MSDFVYGQLVQLGGGRFSTTPIIARYIKPDKNDLHFVHQCNQRWSELAMIDGVVQKDISSEDSLFPIKQKLLFMEHDRTYDFQPGDEIVYKQSNCTILKEKFGKIESVNNEWKYVVLTKPTIHDWEGTKYFYFEQILKIDERYKGIIIQ